MFKINRNRTPVGIQRVFRCPRALSLLLLLLFSEGCQHDVPPVYDGCIGFFASGRDFCEVSIIELLGNPDALNGIDVLVGGFVVADEVSGVYLLVPSIE